MASEPQTIGRFTGITKRVFPVTSTVFHLEFDSEPKLRFRAGQFLSITVPVAGDPPKTLKRAYSIASHPESDIHHLCIKLVENGPGTQYLSKLKPGEPFAFMAPYGHFVYRPNPGGTTVFVATGTGISPFYSMVLSESFRQAPPKRTMVLFGARTEDELLYAREFKAVGAEWVPCLTRPESNWTGFKGRVTDYLRTKIDFDLKTAHFYLCGNGEMIRETKPLLMDRGVDKSQIFQEAYF